MRKPLIVGELVLVRDIAGSHPRGIGILGSVEQHGNFWVGSVFGGWWHISELHPSYDGDIPAKVEDRVLLTQQGELWEDTLALGLGNGHFITHRGIRCSTDVRANPLTGLPAYSIAVILANNPYGFRDI